VLSRRTCSLTESGVDDTVAILRIDETAVPDHAEAERRAAADHQRHLGQIIEVECISGYVGDDQHQRCNAKRPFKVRVLPMDPGLLNHWIGEHLDPDWDVELVEDHPDAYVGAQRMRSLWTYGPTYVVGKRTAPKTIPTAPRSRAKVDLDVVNRHRRSLGMKPIDPATGWTDQEIHEMAKAIRTSGRMVNPATRNPIAGPTWSAADEAQAEQWAVRWPQIFENEELEWEEMWDAEEAAKVLATNTELEVIGVGSNRAVFGWGPHRVLKLGYGGGELENERECARWESPPEELAPWSEMLAPVIACDRFNRWLVMERAQPLDEESERLIERSGFPGELERLSEGDVAADRSDQWGLLHGKIVLIDYGWPSGILLNPGSIKDRLLAYDFGSR
jgi:hypothetical protein